MQNLNILHHLSLQICIPDLGKWKGILDAPSLPHCPIQTADVQQCHACLYRFSVIVLWLSNILSNRISSRNDIRLQGSTDSAADRRCDPDWPWVCLLYFHSWNPTLMACVSVCACGSGLSRLGNLFQGAIVCCTCPPNIVSSTARSDFFPHPLEQTPARPRLTALYSFYSLYLLRPFYLELPDFIPQCLHASIFFIFKSFATLSKRVIV